MQLAGRQTAEPKRADPEQGCPAASGNVLQRIATPCSKAELGSAALGICSAQLLADRPRYPLCFSGVLARAGSIAGRPCSKCQKVFARVSRSMSSRGTARSFFALGVTMPTRPPTRQCPRCGQGSSHGFQFTVTHNPRCRDWTGQPHSLMLPYIRHMIGSTACDATHACWATGSDSARSAGGQRSVADCKFCQKQHLQLCC